MGRGGHPEALCAPQTHPCEGTTQLSTTGWGEERAPNATHPVQRWGQPR